MMDYKNAGVDIEAGYKSVSYTHLSSRPREMWRSWD